MATTITLGGVDITDNVQDWSVQVPTSPVDVAPSASLTTNARVDITATDAVTVTIDGTDIFDGETRSGGSTSGNGQVSVDAAHAFRDVAEDTVTFTESAPTDEEVLQAALDNADGGGAFTLSYAGTATALDNDYECEGRPVKRVFRDMMDRTGRVWWVDPAGTTVHVEPVADRGLWQAIDTQTDRATLRQYDTGSVDTVRNAVEVVGTGDEAVRGVASDNTSISTYGRRTGNSPYNIDYITSASEAAAVAQSLLVPDPLPEGELLVGSNVGDVTQPLANYDIDLTDDGKGVDATGLVIESQTIRQGHAILQVGAGTGDSIAESNRRARNRDDNSEPGSVMPEDRIGDLAISETKIQDDSISTPKLQANSITANEIDVLNLDAGEISVSDPDSSETLIFEGLNPGVRVTASSDTSTLEFGSLSGPTLLIYGNTIEAENVLDADDIRPFNGDDSGRVGIPPGEVVGEGAFSEMNAYSFIGRGNVSGTPEVIPANDQTGSVGKTGNAWQSVRAYNFIDASSGSTINDGGDPLAGLADGHGPPDHALADGNLDLSAAVRSAWDVIRAQERVIEDLTGRVGDLEARLERLEADGDSGDA